MSETRGPLVEAFDLDAYIREIGCDPTRVMRVTKKDLQGLVDRVIAFAAKGTVKL